MALILHNEKLFSVLTCNSVQKFKLFNGMQLWGSRSAKTHWASTFPSCWTKYLLYGPIQARLQFFHECLKWTDSHAATISIPGVNFNISKDSLVTQKVLYELFPAMCILLHNKWIILLIIPVTGAEQDNCVLHASRCKLRNNIAFHNSGCVIVSVRTMDQGHWLLCLNSMEFWFAWNFFEFELTLHLFTLETV